jgi:hypothetical protein
LLFSGENLDTVDDPDNPDTGADPDDPDTGVDPDKDEPDEEDRGLNILSTFKFSNILSSNELAASALDSILLFYMNKRICV